MAVKRPSKFNHDIKTKPLIVTWFSFFSPKFNIHRINQIANTSIEIYLIII